MTSHKFDPTWTLRDPYAEQKYLFVHTLSRRLTPPHQSCDVIYEFSLSKFSVIHLELGCSKEMYLRRISIVNFLYFMEAHKKIIIQGMTGHHGITVFTLIT
jgi:hypothetical protein